ncbi:MAG: HNH endonuclease [Caudoviricetes sp.]|nr:MAG: HNH endonuclease [Caudoviricetes sp.]
MPKKIDKNYILERFKKVHGDTYDYSLVYFCYVKDKISIICKEHGVFEQRVDSHYSGKLCPKCGKSKQVKNYVSNIVYNKLKGLVQPEDYKLIPLTQGKFTKVDNEDFERLNNYSWNYRFSYAANSINGLMHRFIMNCPKDKVVDHINHDTLDNRKCNLRICTQQENSMNKISISDRTSIYKGVFFANDRNKWRSKISKSGNVINIGYFSSEVEAAKSYDKKAKELFGEFAITNF